MRIFITGIAGTGKTSTLAELQKHGYAVVDLDATGMCRWKNKETGETTEYGPMGRDHDWLTKHGWYCDIDTLEKLLSSIREDKDVFIAGIVENIEEASERFDKIFILTANDSTIKNRLTKRENNHFAQKEEEQIFVLTHSRELLGKIKDFIKIDAEQNISDVAAEILTETKKK